VFERIFKMKTFKEEDDEEYVEPPRNVLKKRKAPERRAGIKEEKKPETLIERAESVIRHMKAY